MSRKGVHVFCIRMFRNNLILYANVCTIYKLVLALELRGGGYNPRMYHTYKGGSMFGINTHQGKRTPLLLPLSCVLGLGIACALSQPATALAQNPGWIHEGNTWSYQVSKDTYAKGWYYTPSGKWFYFNKDTYQMVTGKLTDDHKDYWLDENAGLLYDRWVQDAKGNWLHTDDNGVLATGWFKTKSGYWFYFNQDHTMKTGILTDRGYTFWLDKNDGLLYNEWVKDESGKWLHTDGNGCLLTGWYHAPNGKWFYFNDDYTMKVGELKENGKIYTFDVNQGWVKTKTWVPEKGHWENDTERVWIPNVVTVTDKPAWDEKVKTGIRVTFSDGHVVYNEKDWRDYSVKMMKADTPVSYTFDVLYKTVHHDAVTHTEDRGYYEDKVTGKHWVVDEAGHYE